MRARAKSFRFAAKKTGLLLFFALLPGWSGPAAAQDSTEGVNAGNYNIRQSFEFGNRFTDFTGDPGTYNTFVDLRPGPRLLDFTVEMKSLHPVGSLFDRFYLSNFGYGGDPNDVSRLRVSKEKWYNFNALFRRDENDWNYSLLANPLNPASTFANAPAGFNPVLNYSPHLFHTRRKLGDYDLTLRPQSKLRFRLGYSNNFNDGPSFSSYHQGTEALLLQDWRTTVNTYRFGVDFRGIPRTNISYDEFLNYYKGDTDQQDTNQTYQLANVTPVDIGVSLNGAANQPCAGTFLPSGAVNPACNAYIDYSRQGRVRTNTPTEQLSIQSNYFRSVDLSARFSYAAGDMRVYGYQENFSGRESRTNLFDLNSMGPASGRHVAPSLDAGATWHVTKKFRVLDTFNFSTFRDPGLFEGSSCGFFSPSLLTAPNLFTPGFALPAACTPPANGVSGVPVHSASSGADVSTTFSALSLKQEQKTNLFQLEYDFTPKFGGRIGYRFRRRDIVDTNFMQVEEIYYPSNANRGDCALVNGLLPDGCTPNGDGSFTFQTPAPATDMGEVLINEHAGVMGLWARPNDAWRISFDGEAGGADNSYTRISPREWQQYRVRSNYKLTSWANVSGSVDILENRNNVSEVNNLQHNRSYGVSAMIEPSSRLALELGYDYDDVYSQILVCFVTTTPPAGISQCPGIAVLSQALSVYTSTSHYGYFDVMWKPVARLSTHIGANLTSNSGSALVLSPSTPPGPLDSTYYRPYGGFDYLLAKGWTGKAYWGYYGYSEGLTSLPQDLFAPRNFRGNMVTLSMRYAF
jgi:hypothetical protein